MDHKPSESVHAEAICRKVAETLSSIPGIMVAIVYGSAVTGRMRPDSDVDVAVLFDRALDMAARLELWNKLTDALKREVDLVDLYDLGGEILHQIMTKGRVVIKNDAHAYFLLMQRMVYNEEDFMPQVRRVLQKRVRRFAYG
jgi:predicted nucleotidyltransferase